MRCRSHYYDVSSYVGVCASCLRERLSALIEAEAQMSFQALPDHPKQQSNPPPPPQLLFPRSVSPYTIKRGLKDDNASAKHNHWGGKGIFSTPQFEITSDTKTTKLHAPAANKFSVITKLFKSKSAKLKTDKDHPTAPPRSKSVSSSPSWFNSFRRKSKFAQYTPDQTPQKYACIGISPNRTSCGTPRGHQVKNKSKNSASSRRVKSAANFTGLIFGLSPLAQPSPIRLRSHNNSYSSETLSFEPRVPAKATMSTSSSLRGSRSRKLAESQSLIYLN